MDNTSVVNPLDALEPGTAVFGIPVSGGFFWLGELVAITNVFVVLKRVVWVAWTADGDHGRHSGCFNTGHIQEAEPHQPDALSIFPTLQFSWHQWKHPIPNKQIP